MHVESFLVILNPSQHPKGKCMQDDRRRMLTARVSLEEATRLLEKRKNNLIKLHGPEGREYLRKRMIVVRSILHLERYRFPGVALSIKELMQRAKATEKDIPLIIEAAESLGVSVEGAGLELMLRWCFEKKAT